MSFLTNPIITTISGDGPCKAVDLSAAPLAVLMPVIRVAMGVVHEWNEGNINADESSDADEAMQALVKATDAIEALLVDIVPGGYDITRKDLMSADAYPVIRDGRVIRVTPADLSALEKEAVQAWLNFHGAIAKNAAANLKEHGHQLGADVR